AGCGGAAVRAVPGARDFRYRAGSLSRRSERDGDHPGSGSFRGQPPLRPSPVRTRVLLPMALLVLTAAPAMASWELDLDGVDLSASAALRERESDLVANVIALAATLGLRAQIAGDELQLVDADGTEWRAHVGALELTAFGRTQPLRAPLLLTG